MARVQSIEQTRLVRVRVRVRAWPYTCVARGLHLCDSRTRYTVPPSGNLTSPRVSHTCTTSVPRTCHTHICTRARARTTGDHARTPNLRAALSTYLWPITYTSYIHSWYIHMYMYLYEACARCKYFTIDKTSSITS